MSDTLDRFRASAGKFSGAFGSLGTLTLHDGSSVYIVAIPSDPYSPIQVGGVEVGNEAPSLQFETALLPTGQLKDCIWTEAGGMPRQILRAEPSPITGFTRVTLSDP